MSIRGVLDPRPKIHQSLAPKEQDYARRFAGKPASFYCCPWIDSSTLQFRCSCHRIAAYRSSPVPCALAVALAAIDASHCATSSLRTNCPTPGDWNGLQSHLDRCVSISPSDEHTSCDGVSPTRQAGDSQMGINKNQVEGRAKEAGGKVQEAFGKVTGNRSSSSRAQPGRPWVPVRQQRVMRLRSSRICPRSDEVAFLHSAIQLAKRTL